MIIRFSIQHGQTCLSLSTAWRERVTHLRSDCEWLSSLAIAEMCCIGYFAQCTIANEMIILKSE